MKVVVVGLGLMGQAYAERLVERGFNVLLYSTRRGAAEDLASRIGAKPASREDLLSEDSVLLVAGWDDEYLLRVARMVQDGRSILVNMETVTPRASLEAERIVGVERYIEAPVAGGPRVAREGKLPVIAAYRSRETWLKAKPVLEALAATILEVGEPPAAMVVKLGFNNLLFSIVAGMADSVRLVEAWGVEAEKLRELMEATWMKILVERYWGRAWNPDKPHFRLAGAVKDLAAALQAGVERGSRLPVTMAALNEYMEAVERCGTSDIDYTGVVKCLARRKG